MGLYDRDYGRDSEKGGLFPETNTPFTWGLTVLSIVLFVASLFQRQLIDRVGLTWEHLVEDRWFWTLFTHPFFHDTSSPLFILINLLLIYFFGKELEERFGWKAMATIAGSAVAVGAVCFLLGSWAGWLGPRQRLLGLSGVANAVLMAGVLLDPRRSMLLFFVLPVPGWAIVVFTLVLDLGLLSQGSLGAGQAAADIAGLLAGGVCFQILTRGLKWSWPGKNQGFRRRSRPKLAVFRGDSDDPLAEPVSRGASRGRSGQALASADNDPGRENLTVEVDRILEKISHQGLPSLTDAERRILLKASETLKKKS